MSRYEIRMPKLGESVQEALITRWFVAVGEMIEEDQPLFEVATDKVDSEIPSAVSGKVAEILYSEGTKVAVGKVLAIIELDGNQFAENKLEEKKETKSSDLTTPKDEPFTNVGRFLSPLVKSIATREGISPEELQSIEGTGINHRIRKQDVLEYIERRKNQPQYTKLPQGQIVTDTPQRDTMQISISGSDEIIEMSRMRKLIASHMVESVRVAPHVTSFVEADVEKLVRWRNSVKAEFLKREKVNLTYMPVFIEATARALRDFPMVNVSVDGDRIIKHGEINIGIAVATDSGDLIVPVIRQADRKNIVGLAHELADLADRARKGKLSLDEIQAGTFTITNFGSFGNVMGTPIINQPQAAILATGTIEKKPAVMETEYGDVVVVRHKMFLSLSYDHRVIDGALGGAFLKRIAYYLENYNTTGVI